MRDYRIGSGRGTAKAQLPTHKKKKKKKNEKRNQIFFFFPPQTDGILPSDVHTEKKKSSLTSDEMI
jgi:hypothetical protein